MLNGLWETRYYLLIALWIAMLGIGAWLRFRVMMTNGEPAPVPKRIKD